MKYFFEEKHSAFVSTGKIEIMAQNLSIPDHVLTTQVLVSTRKCLHLYKQT